MPHPTLTIVTPSYNQRTFVREAIESVLSQEGDFAIQYLVMDGGSTDGSVEVIAEAADCVAAGRWPIRCAGVSMDWVSRRDGGQSAAINQALKRASGEIIGWINSDDAYAPGAFARVVAAFGAHADADFIYGDGEVIDEHGNLQWKWLSRPYDLRVLTSYHFLWNDFTNYLMQQSTFWRRSVMQGIGYLDESLHFGMDIEYWIRAGARGLTLRHIAQPLGRFRLIAGTKSLSSLTAFWPDYLEIFRRYRGAREMVPFFAFYYFNLARQHRFDVELMMSHRHDVLRQWHSLRAVEQEELSRRADRGFQLGCLLAARDLLAAGEVERARAFVRSSGGSSWTTAMHPLAWPYVLRRLLSPALSSRAEAAVSNVVTLFRRHRYDYRYRGETR